MGWQVDRTTYTKRIVLFPSEKLYYACTKQKKKDNKSYNPTLGGRAADYTTVGLLFILFRISRSECIYQTPAPPPLTSSGAELFILLNCFILRAVAFSSVFILRCLRASYTEEDRGRAA